MLEVPLLGGVVLVRLVALLVRPCSEVGLLLVVLACPVVSLISLGAKPLLQVLAQALRGIAAVGLRIIGGHGREVSPNDVTTLSPRCHRNAVGSVDRRNLSWSG